MVSLEFSIDISNWNECQEYLLWGKGGRCVGLTNLSPSCADFLQVWEPQPPGNLRACPGSYRDWFTSTSARECITSCHITCLPCLFPLGVKFRSIYLRTMLLDFCGFCENSVQGKAVLFLWSNVTDSRPFKKFPAV